MLLTGKKLFIAWLRMSFPIMGMKHYVGMVKQVVFVHNGSSDCNLLFVSKHMCLCACVLECTLLGIEMY